VIRRPTLGLALIAKNEAENLPQLFASFEGCFDEVHLTDTGSTDNTVEVAKRLGAIVHHFDWCNDFSAARNASFQPVKTDYVMWLDCDDVLENKEAFIHFRDNLMTLSDYWMATYHYSSDDTGKATCSFIRERVFRVNKQFQWRYFVHEGVLPISSYGDVKPHFIPSWAVRHKRTAQDLSKDRMRNLNLFEANKDKMDSRMKYYYGKELFEAGKPVEAAATLLDAVADPVLDLHDRILGIQYACGAFAQCGQIDRVLQLAQQGLLLAPNRSEFLCILGDIYLKQNKLMEAVPFFSAAKSNFAPSNPLIPRTVFHEEQAYTTYPRNTLARIFVHMGDLERAKAELNDCMARFPNPETQALLSEVEKIQGTINSYQGAKACDDIVISTPPMNAYEWDADIAKKKAMGGSETAGIEMAHWLHQLSGRPVKVFNMRADDKVCDGVEYISNQKVHEYFSKHKPWMHIAWRHNIKLTDAPTFLWCHDLITPGAENTTIYNKHLCLTPFHQGYTMAMQGVPKDKIFVTRNGIKPERFKDGPWKKDPNKIVFPSSPDRGLDRAMRVLDKVREEFPDVKLHVFYGIEHLPKWGHQVLHDRLKAMMEERKDWVVYHGATQQDELIKHFKEASIWLHPCDFVETSCITATEMTCAGVYPVTRRLGGLADTLSFAESKGMATLIDSDCITESEYQLYIDATKKALRERSWESVSIDPEQVSWRRVAEEWLRELPLLAEAEGMRASA
jgi:glycosyltransferase involved in cell wall biosynthesis